jgi:zinc protease
MVFLLIRRLAAITSLLFLLIGPNAIIQAQPAPSAQTGAAKQASPFVLPITKRDSLLNGLQLIVMERPGTGTVTIRLRINSGAMFDLSGKGGLAWLTAEMVLKGGSGLTAKNIADTIEQLGMTLIHNVGWDTTEFVISGPADSLDAIFDLLNRAIISPAFDQKEFDALKAQRIQSARARQDDEAELVKAKALEATFGTHPYGKPSSGTAESIGQIARADLTYFHNRFYIANNAELMVTGDASVEQITRFARTRLGSWKKGEVVPASFRSPDAASSPRILILDRPEGAISRAAIVQAGPSRRSDDFFAAMIMAETLRQMSAKLAEGAAGATMETEFDARLLPTPWVIKIKSQTDDLPSLIQSAFDAMRALQAKPAAIEDVEAAKARMIATMSERLKTDDGVAQVILDIETYGLGRDYLIKFAERVNAITPADAMRAAQTYLKPQTAVTAMAGPASKLEGPAKKMGTVTIVR